MRALLVTASAALMLAACGSNNDATVENDMNALATENVTLDPNAPGAGGMDGNVATNSEIENAMHNDLTHNDADTNLANGM